MFIPTTNVLTDTLLCSIPLDHNSLKEIVRHIIPTYFLTDVSFNKTVHDQPETPSVISV